MYNADRFDDLSNDEVGADCQLNLEDKMARAQEEEGEIASGLMNVMLRRMQQQGRLSFCPGDYRTLQLTIGAIMYLGSGGDSPSPQLQAVARAIAKPPRATVTSEERSALILAAQQEGSGI